MSSVERSETKAEVYYSVHSRVVGLGGTRSVGGVTSFVYPK